MINILLNYAVPGSLSLVFPVLIIYMLLCNILYTIFKEFYPHLLDNNLGEMWSGPASKDTGLSTEC